MSQSSSLRQPSILARRGKAALLALTLVVGTTAPISHVLAEGMSGAVFTMTNSAVSANKVVAYARQEDGSLELSGAFPTGGVGSGPAPTSTLFGSPVPATADGLGSQNSLILSGDRRFLFAVNAGSNSIACFRVNTGTRGPLLSTARTVGSGGVFPVSLTFRGGNGGGVLYVLNSGRKGNITGFGVTGDCTMNPLSGGQSGSLRGLTDDPPFPSPVPNEVLTTLAQVEFTPSGSKLVVSLKGGPGKTGTGADGGVAVFDVRPSGALRSGPPKVTEFSSETKTAGQFGFTFDATGKLLLNHGNSFTFGSYLIEDAGTLEQIGKLVPISGLKDGSVLRFGSFNCWVVRRGNVVYVMSFGNIPFTSGGLPDGPGVISALRVASDGSLELLPVKKGGAEGVVALLPNNRHRPGFEIIGNHGIDLTVVEDGQRAFLYAIEPLQGQIGAWRINADGTLRLVGRFDQGLQKGVDPFAGTNPGINDFLERCFLQGKPRSPECVKGSAQGLAGF